VPSPAIQHEQSSLRDRGTRTLSRRLSPRLSKSKRPPGDGFKMLPGIEGSTIASCRETGAPLCVLSGADGGVALGVGGL